MVHQSPMVSEEFSQETTVIDGGTVTIPAGIRQRLDIKPGDKLRWDVTDEGDLIVEVIRQRFGVFDDYEPVEWEGDALTDHDLMGLDDEIGPPD